MVSEDSLANIKDCFREIPLLGYWAAIQATYNNMGFSDPMSDSQLIGEYSYISEQMHKFVSKKYTEIMRYQDNLEAMIDCVDEIIDRLEDTSNDRRTLVYYMLRDDWLAQLRNVILWELEDNEMRDEVDNA